MMATQGFCHVEQDRWRVPAVHEASARFMDAAGLVCARALGRFLAQGLHINTLGGRVIAGRMGLDRTD